jgi:hypothetical protein
MFVALRWTFSIASRKYYFTNRVVEDWNNLPETVITAKNVKIFENRLDKLWQNHPMMYDHTYNDI